VRIAELYPSLQGEGLLAGTPSVFVRSSGCNLRCRWCDTPFTSWRPEGEERDSTSIAEAVAATALPHVVLTGGEPLLAPDAAEVCAALREGRRHLTVETAGTVLPRGADPAALADLVSVSPKLASSAPDPDTAGDWHRRHAAARRDDGVIAALLAAPSWQLKFVVGSRADLDETLAWLDDLDGRFGPRGLPRRRVFVMPEGTDPGRLAAQAAWLRPAAEAEGLRYAPRHHIAWYGNRRGT